MSDDELRRVDVLIERIENLTDRLDRFEEVADDQFVRKAEFLPVQRAVYSGISVVLGAVMMAILNLVIRS